MRFKYGGVEMEAEGEVDQRGSRGVRPYFNWVRLRIKVRSRKRRSASPSRPRT